MQHESSLFRGAVTFLLIASVTASYQIEEAIATPATLRDYVVHRLGWAGDAISAVFV